MPKLILAEGNIIIKRGIRYLAFKTYLLSRLSDPTPGSLVSIQKSGRRYAKNQDGIEKSQVAPAEAETMPCLIIFPLLNVEKRRYLSKFLRF